MTIEKPTNEMTKKELRIAIAKDVLLRLRKKSFIPSKGIYLAVSGEAEHFARNNKNQQAQENLDTLTKNCRVCAIGSLFVGFVAVKNNTSNIEFIHSDDFHLIARATEEVFSKQELETIENYYEDWRGSYGWLECYQDNRQRMRAIMKNIIRNDGTFEPEKEPKVHKLLQKEI